MWTEIINWLKKIFGKESVKKTELEQIDELGYVIKYEDVTEFNIVSIIANKLSNIVCSEVSAEVISQSPVTAVTPPFKRGQGNNKDSRMDFLDEGLQKCVSKLHLITARAFGIGGVVLKPYIFNGDIYIDIIPQNRFFVVERCGEVITKAGFIADVYFDENEKEKQKNKKKYVRIEYHSLDENGVYKIENKVLVSDSDKSNKESVEVALGKTVWKDIPQCVCISGVDKMLFAFVKCPVDNKKEACLTNGGTYGVPITYGQNKLIKMILDLLNEIPDEYRNKKTFIGADDLLFDSESRLPDSGLYKLFRANGGIDKQSFWEVFSPEIRHSSYFDGLDYLFGLLEKAVSVNKGILTDMNVENATATAIKRSTLDTFSTVYAMRKNIEDAIGQLIYAFGVIGDAFDLCEKSTRDYKIKFDWNYGLLEDGAETWKQYLEGYNAGAVKLEELRMYLFNEDRKTAEGFVITKEKESPVTAVTPPFAKGGEE